MWRGFLAPSSAFPLLLHAAYAELLPNLLCPLPASAGTGNILDSELAEELLVPESAEAEQADFVISVGGDSMEPTYHDGDKVFVEKCDSVGVGEVGIFILNGEAYIKELGNKCLISHNEKYKPIRIGESDSVYCCGRVIGIVE